MELAIGGRRLFAATGGGAFDAARPTVVFLHGAGMDHSIWALQTRWFAHHGRNVLALDLPGHGRSEGPSLSDIGAMAASVLAVLDAVGAARAALVGHSMGALVALEAYKGAAEAARRATQPMLFLLGEDDRMTPTAKAAAFARELKQARCV